MRSCNSVKMLENGEALFPEMLTAIRGAKKKVYLSSYIFDNDETGKEFIKALSVAEDT